MILDSTVAVVVCVRAEVKLRTLHYSRSLEAVDLQHTGASCWTTDPRIALKLTKPRTTRRQRVLTALFRSPNATEKVSFKPQHQVEGLEVSCFGLCLKSTAPSRDHKPLTGEGHWLHLGSRTMLVGSRNVGLLSQLS